MVAYRSSVHDSTGETPSLLMLGREVELPIDMLFGRNDSPKFPSDSYSEYVKNLQANLYDLHELARAQSLQLEPDRRRNMTIMQTIQIPIGDLVLLNAKRISKLNPTFCRNLEGLYKLQRLFQILYMTYSEVPLGS